MAEAKTSNALVAVTLSVGILAAAASFYAATTSASAANTSTDTAREVEEFLRLQQRTDLVEERRLAGYVAQSEANQLMVESARQVLDFAYYNGSREMDPETRRRFHEAIGAFDLASLEAATAAVLPTFVGTDDTAPAAEAATEWRFRMRYRVLRVVEAIEVEAYSPELEERIAALGCDVGNASRSNQRMLFAFVEDLSTRNQSDYSTAPVSPLSDEGDLGAPVHESELSESRCVESLRPPPL